MAGRSKRSRANPPVLDNSDNDGYPRPLTCVRVVCQNGPDLLRLPHIVAKLDEFLDSPWKWTLTSACASDSPHLVERLLVGQEAEPATSLRHRPNYRQWQFDKSMDKTLEVGNLKIVPLLVKHFHSCTVSDIVVENAAMLGLSKILKWLVERGCDIKWTADAVSEAIENKHFEMAKWLREKLPTVSVDEMIEWVVIAADKGDLAMVEWVCGMLAERDSNGRLRYLSENVNLWRAVQHATSSGQPRVLKWIMDEPNRTVLLYELLGREFDGTSPVGIDLSRAAADGHIAVLTWLIQQYPKLCNIGSADRLAPLRSH